MIDIDVNFLRQESRMDKPVLKALHITEISHDQNYIFSEIILDVMSLSNRKSTRLVLLYNKDTDEYINLNSIANLMLHNVKYFKFSENNRIVVTMNNQFMIVIDPSKINQVLYQKFYKGIEIYDDGHQTDYDSQISIIDEVLVYDKTRRINIIRPSKILTFNISCNAINSVFKKNFSFDEKYYQVDCQVVTKLLISTSRGVYIVKNFPNVFFASKKPVLNLKDLYVEFSYVRFPLTKLAVKSKSY